jgi:hypothetical protein
MVEKNQYSEQMREKSNYDLQQIIQKYPDEDSKKVIAALRELEKRDVLYSEDKKLLEDLEEESTGTVGQNPEPREVTPFSVFRDPNITDDFNAPKLYSRYAIRFFAIIFSTFFGGILLGINLNRLGKKREIYYVIIFSFLFSILAYQLSLLSPDNATTITIIMNLLGSVILEEFFWKRYIGKHFKFRRQSLSTALLIGFGISLLLGYILISSGVA